MKKKLARGGARPGAGRPTPDNVRNTRAHQVTLDAASEATLRALGEGNLSAGIRRAAALARECRLAP
jgi:hypothetical protein